MAEEQTALIQKSLKGVLSDAVLKRELERIEKSEIETRAVLTAKTGDVGSPEEAVAFASEYLEHPSEVWRKSGIATKTKLQWFQFPSGITFDGKKFGTAEISTVFKAKEAFLPPLSASVDRTGLEPATPALQMRCSTR